VPLTFDDPPTPTEPTTVQVIERTVGEVRDRVLPLLAAAVARG
jgi:hypothetical protein